MPLTFVTYARFSSELQRDTSIEDQNRICRSHIDKEGGQLAKAYSDYAVSGASMARSGLKQLMDDAARGLFDIVVVEGLDRLSRDAEHIAGIYKRLSFHNVRIYSLTDGGFVSDIHIAFGGAKNALFLKDLAFKIKRGQTGRVAQGKSMAQGAYGYDIVRRFDAKGQPVRGERSINEEQATIIRRVFNDYARGLSAHKIALMLNEENIPSPSNARWSSSSINKTILNNELYIGRLIWNRYSTHKDPDTEQRKRRKNPKEDWVIGHVPELRIIEQALWDKVKTRQVVYAAKTTPHQKRRPKHLLSYLLKCGVCGSGYSQKSKNHYGCTRHKTTRGCTNRRMVSKSALEQAIMDAIAKQLLKPEQLDNFIAEYQRHLDTLKHNQQGNIKHLKSQLSRLDNEKTRLIGAIKAGIPAETLKDEFNDNATQRNTVITLIEQFSQSATTPKPDSTMAQKYEAAIHAITQELRTGTPDDEAIDLIRRLIDKIVITPRENSKINDIQIHGDITALLGLDVQPTIHQQEMNNTLLRALPT